MSDTEHLIATYEQAINSTEDAAQRAAAREALADDFQFVGPRAGKVVGRDNWVDTINTMRAEAGGDVRIRRTTQMDEHNGWLRFGWEFVDGTGDVMAQGEDVARVVDGRLVQVVAFFGELQPLEGARRDG